MTANCAYRLRWTFCVASQSETTQESGSSRDSVSDQIDVLRLGRLCCHSLTVTLCSYYDNKHTSILRQKAEMTEQAARTMSQQTVGSSGSTSEIGKTGSPTVGDVKELVGGHEPVHRFVRTCWGQFFYWDI